MKTYQTGWLMLNRIGFKIWLSSPFLRSCRPSATRTTPAASAVWFAPRLWTAFLLLLTITATSTAWQTTTSESHYCCLLNFLTAVNNAVTKFRSPHSFSCKTVCCPSCRTFAPKCAACLQPILPTEVRTRISATILRCACWCFFFLTCYLEFLNKLSSCFVFLFLSFRAARRSSALCPWTRTITLSATNVRWADQR